jgi:PKD repeat protein
MKTNLQNGKTIASLCIAVVLSLASFMTKAQSTCGATLTHSTDTSGTTVFTAIITGAMPDYQYIGYGDGSTATVTPNGIMPHTYSCNGTYVVGYAIGTNDSLCNAYITDTVVITNLQPCGGCNLVANFTATVDANDTTGLTYTFTNTSTGAHANPTWSNWNFGDGVTLSTGGWNPVSHTYAQAGGYIVLLTAQDTGLANCMNTYNDSILVGTGNGGGNPSGGNTCGSNFFISQDSTTALTWNAYPNYSTSATQFTWSWGDNAQSTGMYPSHTYATAGTYTICLTVLDSCGTSTYCDSASIYRVSSANAVIQLNVINPNAPTALKTTINKALVSMYPNPANSKLTVSIAQNDNSVITMYDAIGKQVMQQKATGLSTELNVSNLPQGMYFVNVNGTTQKVVISE